MLDEHEANIVKDSVMVRILSVVSPYATPDVI